MRKNLYKLIMVFPLLATLSLKAQIPGDLPQLLADKAICIDPGHGGYGSDDRKTDIGYGLTYWESEGNFNTANYLYANLEALGCDVSITRITNEYDADDAGYTYGDPSIADRVAFSEEMEADFFHSVHTNGVDNNPSINYHLMLYASLDKDHRKTAQFPLAKEMADIMSVDLPKVVYTTSAKVYADLDFQPTWSSGYGILNGSSVPAVISEASFHSNPEEGRRLHSDMYQQAMAMQMMKSHLKLLGTSGSINYGEIKGIVESAAPEDLNGVTVKASKDDTLVREVTTDNGYNGYYFMGWMEPGDYKLEFSKDGSVLKTETVTVVKMEDIVEQLSIPIQVTINNILSNLDGSINFDWEPLRGNYVGYRIYYSEDPALQNWKLALDEDKLTESVSGYTCKTSDFINSPSNTTLFFKIVGVNKNDTEELEGPTSKVFSTFSNESGLNILLVDGFDRMTGTNSGGRHTLTAKYTSGLSNISIIGTVSSVDNSSIISGSVIMNDYELVIWISGEESTADETFSSAEQIKVKDYLENGGNFIVSGAEIGWDLDHTSSSHTPTAADMAFYSDYLKAEYKSDGGATYGTSDGIEGTIFEGLSIAFNNADGWEIKYPDGIAPAGGAEKLMDFSNGDGYSSAIGYKGTFGTSSADGGLIYYSFPLGAAVQSDNELLLNKSFEYFYGDLMAIDDWTAINLSTYPNPASDKLTITGLENKEAYQIELFSTVGSLVYSKYVTIKSGEHNINTSGLESGVYILRISNQNGSVSTKILKN
ncbi:MAG: N-acetylmuramoyl-L-alanine amidase [Bacteroidota bacterium]